MHIIDCHSISEAKRRDIRNRIEALKAQHPGEVPKLAIVAVGDNDASKVYARNKIKACDAVGISATLWNLPYETTTEELLAKVSSLTDVHGVIVQLPLPDHIDADALFDNLNACKDVDCLSTFNYGSLMSERPQFLPCTPQGIMDIIHEEIGYSLPFTKAVVIGRSKLVGHSIATLLMKANATVTLCHSKTSMIDLQNYVSNADIVVVAVGQAKFFDPRWVKDGAVIIDVGINRDKNGHLCGDVDYTKTSYPNVKCTPVPGGVGIMTVTSLLNNVLIAFENHCKTGKGEHSHD